MSPETLQWLHGLVNSVTISVGAPGAEESAQRAFQARYEIEQALARLDQQPES